ncbi:MAG: hypothetical protein WCA78_15595 [Rhizomicrobium sp.]|jgi:hypothetical protein
MAQEILCITAGQRSGTTALRSLISGTDRFADLGEIFDTSTIDLPESFFGYCRQRKLQLVDVLSGPDAEGLCKDYMSVLRNKAGAKHLLFDVKFNSWGEIRMPWTYMHQEPFFLTQLKWMKAKLLFVWRQDIVAQILSDRISDRIGKWHNLEPGDAREPFVFDVEKIKTRAMLLCLSERYFYHNLKMYPHVLMLGYERLFNADGALALDVRAKLSRLMQEDYVFPETCLYHKNNLDKTGVVANYAEVASAIREVAAVYREPLLAANTQI